MSLVENVTGFFGATYIKAHCNKNNNKFSNARQSAQYSIIFNDKYAGLPEKNFTIYPKIPSRSCRTKDQNSSKNKRFSMKEMPYWVIIV